MHLSSTGQLIVLEWIGLATWRYWVLSFVSMQPKRSPTTSARKSKRQFLCAHYSACLDHAISQAWEGFTCVECREYAPEAIPEDTDHWTAQAVRSARLLSKVFSPKPPSLGGKTKRRNAFHGCPTLTLEERAEQAAQLAECKRRHREWLDANRANLSAGLVRTLELLAGE